ncbi:ParA family protein [Micromonospora sp. NPDC005298]|uniref:ParA family protein n=1 Tax=Micromonospora sp. NPDC005298 TaxID=3156873 RepID=UPI0033AA2B7C
MRVLTTVNLKGGSGKTTTAAYLAHAFADRGRRPIVVDADPQGSAVRWQGLADWPLPAVALPTATLHRQLAGVVDRKRFDLVVIDTPPLEDRHGIVVSALRVATDVLVTMAPTMMELDRIGPVWKAIEDATGYRDDDPSVSVLFNRVVTNASSTQALREVLTEQGRRVLTATIPRREAYAQAFGSPIGRDDPHGRVAEELLTMWGER